MTMAGRPKRRANRAALEAALEGLEPLPEDATIEQQRERVRAGLRAFRKADREQGIRAGRVKPRTHEEMRLFGSDLKDLDAGGDA